MLDAVSGVEEEMGSKVRSCLHISNAVSAPPAAHREVVGCRRVDDEEQWRAGKGLQVGRTQHAAAVGHALLAAPHRARLIGSSQVQSSALTCRR